MPHVYHNAIKLRTDKEPQPEFYSTSRALTHCSSSPNLGQDQILDLVC